MNKLRHWPPFGIIGGGDYAFTKTLERLNCLREESKTKQLKLNFEFIEDQDKENQEKVYSSTFPTRLTPEEFKKHYGWYNPDSAIESEPEEDDEE